MGRLAKRFRFFKTQFRKGNLYHSSGRKVRTGKELTRMLTKRSRMGGR